MIRLYIETPLFEKREVFLTENQSHYVQKVMRLREGEVIQLFNGTDGEWKARILEIAKRTTKMLLLFQTRSQNHEGDLWLLFSPLKPKRQEFLIEKATELGVSCLLPLHFERTSIPKANHEKMRAHTIEAAEQCGRLTIPEIKPSTLFATFLKDWPQERFLFFGDETLNSPSISAPGLKVQKPYAFLVGPEGGFTDQELSFLRSHPQAQGVTLSSNILRAETAALVGLSYLQIQF